MKFRILLLALALVLPVASASALPSAPPDSVSLVSVGPAHAPVVPNSLPFSAMALATTGAAAAGAAAKTRKLNLSQSYIFNGETFGPGNDIEVPADFPEIDGETGDVIWPAGSTAARNAAASARINGTEVRTTNRVDSSPSSGPGLGVTVSGLKAEELEGMTKGELEALAQEKGITVTRGDGTDGTPLKEDYVQQLGATATA